MLDSRGLSSRFHLSRTELQCHRMFLAVTFAVAFGAFINYMQFRKLLGEHHHFYHHARQESLIAEFSTANGRK